MVWVEAPPVVNRVLVSELVFELVSEGAEVLGVVGRECSGELVNSEVLFWIAVSWGEELEVEGELGDGDEGSSRVFQRNAGFSNRQLAAFTTTAPASHKEQAWCNRQKLCAFIDTRSEEDPRPVIGSCRRNGAIWTLQKDVPTGAVLHRAHQ